MTLTRMNRPKFTDGISRESVVELSTHNQIPPNNTPADNGKMASIIRSILLDILYIFLNIIHCTHLSYSID